LSPNGKRTGKPALRNSAITMASLISPIDLVFAISKIVAENRLE